MEKENNSNESDFSENEIPDLNSLKPFEFEPKTNIGDINSSSSDDEEEGESKTDNSMVTVSGASAVQKQSLEDVLQNRCQPCNFIKKRLQHRCFPMKFTKSLRTPFFLQNTSTLMTASGSKHCKPMKTYTEIFILLRKK